MRSLKSRFGAPMASAIAAALLLLLSGCSGVNPTEGPPDPSLRQMPNSEPVGPIPDEEAADLMDRLINRSGTEFQIAVDRILSADDQRFIGVFIELLRANQLSLVPGSSFEPTLESLETLSGQTFGNDWPAWVEWYGTTDLQPPPGFTAWKGRLLSRIDPRFSDFLKEDQPSRIRAEEIVWGGVLVDGIPALDNPAMISAEQADYLKPEDPVFGISLNGDSRAYPLRIMDWHEMANDVVGGVPVSLAYCTLCGAGIAFEGELVEGEPLTFGSSGFLYRSNKLMYDRNTNTLWNQLTGRPVLGSLAGFNEEGEIRQLELLPVVLTAWSEWSSQHPDTLVLDPETGFNRPYEPGAAYGSYFQAGDTMFPVWQRSDLLPAKSRIFALRVEGVPKAYPLETLIQEQVVNDLVGEVPVVLIAPHQQVSVAGEDLRNGQFTYLAGGEVRAYLREEKQFQPGGTGGFFDQEGQRWQITEGALLGPGGQRLERLPGHLAYWFGWYAFFPQTQVYGKE